MDVKNIWIIEDNTSDVYLINVALERTMMPLDVTVMTEGEEALRNIEQVQAGTRRAPHLLLLDLYLPKTDGTTLLDRIHSGRAFAHTCIGVFSSLPEAHGIHLHSSDYYLQKSPHLTEFVLSIVNWVRSCMERAA